MRTTPTGNLIFEHRAASPGARSVLGGCFAILQHVSAHFNLSCPVRQCGDAVRPQLWPSNVWSISAVFGRCAKVTFKLLLRTAENGRNRPRLAIFPFPAFRVRALSLSSTVNRAHIIPRSVTTGKTPQTRDRGVKTHGIVRYAPEPNVTTCKYLTRPMSGLWPRRNHY